MLTRDRDGAIALGLGLAFMAVFGIGLWSGVDPDGNRPDPVPKNNSYEAASPGSELSARDAFWLTHTGNSESYEAICNQPIDHDQADLCQQWRSAERATEIAFYTKLQLAFSLLGIFGLIVTIIYSRKATIAATNGVRAAFTANRTAREMGQAQVRAYLFCERGEYTVGIDAVGIQIFPTRDNLLPGGAELWRS